MWAQKKDSILVIGLMLKNFNLEMNSDVHFMSHFSLSTYILQEMPLKVGGGGVC